MQYNVIYSCVFLNFLNCATSQIVSTLNKTELDNNDVDSINEIRRPQMSTIQKFRYDRQAYTIFDDADSVDFLKDSENNTNVVNLTSINYPEPYPVGQTLNLNITVSNATGIEIVLHVLDIDATSDYLRLTLFTNDGIEKKSDIFTGNLKQPLKMRALGFTYLQITFKAGTVDGHSHKGYLLSYRPYGGSVKPVVIPPDVKIPFDEMETISRFIVVKEVEQTIPTWNRIKDILCYATNNFTSVNSPKLESCSSKNVTFIRVTKCPSFWPNQVNCIELTFAITLYNNRSKLHDPIDPFFQDITPRVPAGLNITELQLMWTHYGRSMLTKNGIEEYMLPDTRMTILTWVGIAIGIVVLFFLIFVAIFRLPTVRERWIEDEIPPKTLEEVIENKPEDDITMFPSPDQILPDLYQGPSSQNYNYGYSTSISPEYSSNLNEARDASLIVESPRNPHPSFEAINEGMEIDDESNYSGSNNLKKANAPGTHQVRF